jgi:hypothetical protein
MRLDFKQTSPDDGASANKLLRTLLASKLPSQASGRKRSVCAWEDRLIELADYRRVHGHCNVPKNYHGNTQLVYWLGTQRREYRLHQEGKKSHMTTSRIQELESLGFEWDSHSAAWVGCLSELADYRKILGHCNVSQGYIENTKLAKWVGTQRCKYRLHSNGKSSTMTTFRIRLLESLGFEWDIQGAAWKACLSELAKYRKIYWHCDVRRGKSENTIGSHTKGVHTGYTKKGRERI